MQSYTVIQLLAVPGPYLPFVALHGPHCPNCDFAKPALEKQTSQLGLSVQQYMGSVWI